MSEVFEVSLSRTPARRVHQRAFGAIDDDYPWAALDPEAFPRDVVALARVSWTEAAFNEHCTAAAMGQLLTALTQARVPLDLLATASGFIEEEVLHVELCSRVAMRLGGGAPIRYEPEDIVLRLDPGLTPLQRANELVVRLCCVGEAFSFPLLRAVLANQRNALTKAVLTTIVKDEAMHGRLGFWYLDWIGEALDEDERRRLGRAAAETLERYMPIWNHEARPPRLGRAYNGIRLDHIARIGWAEPHHYETVARQAIERAVWEPLSRYGIEPPPAAR